MSELLDTLKRLDSELARVAAQIDSARQEHDTGGVADDTLVAVRDLVHLSARRLRVLVVMERHGVEIDDGPPIEHDQEWMPEDS